MPCKKRYHPVYSRKATLKPEFMTLRAVNVCVKAAIGRSHGYKKPCFCVKF